MYSASIIQAFLWVTVVSATMDFADHTLDHDWRNYKHKLSKNFQDQSEEQLRRLTWESHFEKVQQHNAAADDGKQTYYLDVNQFADRSPAEYQKMRGLLDLDESDQSNRKKKQATYYSTVNVTLPDSVDWTAVGWVNPVRYQGSCGCCYAFAAIGALEAQYYNVTDTSAVLSVQNIVDCSSINSSFTGNLGCNGGSLENVYNYVRINKGVASNADYPFVTKKLNCTYKVATNVTTLTRYLKIKTDDEIALQQAVALIGPVAAGMDASSKDFQLYKSGIFNPANCSTTKLDHGILVVGYGTLSGTDYWLIKNSWGTSWGLKGYMMLARNANNTCGIAHRASVPIII